VEGGVEVEGGVQQSAQLTHLEMECNGAISMLEVSPRDQILTVVLASFNALSAVPSQLSRHGASLKKLHLGCNRITDASVAAVLPHLGRLQELCLEGNRLTALPEAIGGLSKLRELWVHGNALAALPSALGRCASLTVLQAHHNLLRELPAALAALPLQGLYLQHNQLTHLAALRETVLRHLPLQNLALGGNRFDLAEAFLLPECRVGLGWNLGTPPPSLPTLTDWFATSDHRFEAACEGERGDLLLLAFSAQGPGMQQWHAPCAAVRAAGVQLDTLYVADPSNSFYLQDPSGSWQGLAHFDAILRRHTAPYGRHRVLAIGSSMGATACLQHAGLAAHVLSFAPRIDLVLSHGAFVPAPTRAASLEAIVGGLAACQHGAATVHVGGGNHVDVAQVASVAGLASVHVVEHDTFHHNVPQFLQQQGELVPLLKDEMMRVLRAAEETEAAGEG